MLKNFKLSEFGSFPVGEDTIELLVRFQYFRNEINKPFNITSFYRTAAQNKKVGGASNSLHLKSEAVDFKVNYNDYRSMAELWLLFANNSERFSLSHIFGEWVNGLKIGDRGTLEIGENYFHLDLRKWNDSKFHILVKKQDARVHATIKTLAQEKPLQILYVDYR